MSVLESRCRLAVTIVCAASLSIFTAAQSLALDCKPSAVTAKSTQQHKTKAAAEDEAKTNWVDKVWKAYGPNWHNLGISQGQNLACEPIRGRWSCTFTSIPCRSHS